MGSVRLLEVRFILKWNSSSQTLMEKELAKFEMSQPQTLQSSAWLVCTLCTSNYLATLSKWDTQIWLRINWMEMRSSTLKSPKYVCGIPKSTYPITLFIYLDVLSYLGYSMLLINWKNVVNSFLHFTKLHTVQGQKKNRTSWNTT